VKRVSDSLVKGSKKCEAEFWEVSKGQKTQVGGAEKYETKEKGYTTTEGRRSTNRKKKKTV